MLLDLLGGRVQSGITDLPTSLGYIRAGKLRALAVGTATRLDILRDIPTVAEILLPRSDVDFADRVTFAAIKGARQGVMALPEMAALGEADCPERAEVFPHPSQSRCVKVGKIEHHNLVHTVPQPGRG